MAAGAGYLAASTSATATFGLIGLGLAVLSILILRRSSAAPAGAAVPAEALASAEGLRWSRRFFYIGMLTVTQTTWRPVLGITVSQFFFLAAFAGALFATMRGRRVAAVPAGLVAGAGIFAFGGAISSLGAESPVASGAETLQAVYVMLLWVWTGAMILRTREQLMMALGFWAGSAAINGLFAVTQTAGITLFTGSLTAGRASGLTLHPNDIGAALSGALVPALLLATRWSVGEPTLIRILRWSMVALIAAGLALSGSLAGALAALVALVVWLSSPAVRTPLRVGLVSGLALFLISVLVFAGDRVVSPTERLEQVVGSETSEGTSGVRVQVAETAWPRIVDNPLVGTGLDPAGSVVEVATNRRDDLLQPHGIFLAAWYGAGLFGLLGILAVLGSHLGFAWRAMRSARDRLDLVVGWALLGGFAAFLVHAMTAPLFFHQFGWLPGVLLVAWGVQTVAERRQAPARQAKAPARRAPLTGSPDPAGAP